MIGIVIGSGLGALADLVEVHREVSFEGAGLPDPRVPGHAGRLLFGSISGVPVVVAHGRIHLYEGWEPAAVTAGIRFLAGCGVRRLVLTNAAGAIHADFGVGEWMMLSDHLNLTGRSPLTGSAKFVDLSEVYSRRMREEFRAAAVKEGLVLREGVYAGVVGPHYETPAEVRFLRSAGADAVGMSTVLEAIEARALGLEVAAFSCLTNLAAGLGNSTPCHEDVVACGKRAADELARLVARWIRGS